MLITFFRAIVLYIIVLIVMRLMGKREIGQMQPFELAIAIMIADLAATPMTEIGIPLLYGFIPILGLLFMHIAISLINLNIQDMYDQAYYYLLSKAFLLWLIFPFFQLIGLLYAYHQSIF